MSEKPGVIVRPILQNSHAGVVKLGAGDRIDCERCPKTNQDQHQRYDLSSHAGESQRKQEYVAQSDLCERVLEGEVGLRRMQRAENDAEENEDECAPGC